MKKFRHLAFALAVLVPLALSPKAEAQSALPGVGQVSIDESANTLTLVVPYNGRNPYRVLWLNAPKRLVVDIEGMRLAGRQRSLFIGGGVVNQIRAGHFKWDVTRVVFDLAQAADLRVVTDGATRTLRITVYPLGGQPGTSMGNVPIATQPTVRPTARPTAKPTVKPTPPIAMATPTPGVRITPVPLPTLEATPTPEPTATPRPQPSVEPTPMPEFSPEPLPSEEPVVEVQEFMVFGSRLYAGAEMPMGITEEFPNGNASIDVSGGLGPFATVGGVFGWDQMFSPNFGLSLAGRAMSYTIEDQALTTDATQLLHKRTDIETALRLRGRLPLFFGLELMAEPGFMVRMMGVDNSNNANGTVTAVQPVDQYLYSGWLGYGPSIGGGLGWHLFGPMSIAATGEYNILFAGSMNQAGVSPIFPMNGWRVSPELRLDMGWFGLNAGYNMTNWTYTGADANDTLTQSWAGPYVRMNIVY